MAKKNNDQEEGYGKHILIEKIRGKFGDIFLPPEESEKIIISSYTLLEGIHFSLVYFPLKHLGYKSVISSAAGIYDKGGKPEALFVNIGVSSRFTVEDIETIIEGIGLACTRYNLSIAGLNIDSSLTGLTISITSTGSRDDEPGVLKGIPSPTDLICISGDLGAAYMGLQLLERERRVFEETGGSQPQLKGYEYVIGRQLKPEINISLLDDIKNRGLTPTSVRVVKEGLASDLIGLARRYNLGYRLYHDKIPYEQETADAGKEFGIEPLISALNGGEDYEFVFTFPVSDFDELKKIDMLGIAGHMTAPEEGYSLSLQDGSLAEIKAQGWVMGDARLRADRE